LWTLLIAAATPALALDMETRGSMPADWEWGKQFGHSLAVADMDCNGIDDLIIGAPMRSVNGHEEAGMVYVIMDGTKNLDGKIVTITQSNGGEPEPGDHFGWAVASHPRLGKHNASYSAEEVPGSRAQNVKCGAVIIGAPDDDNRDVPDTGAITAVWGNPGFANNPTADSQTMFQRRDHNGLKIDTRQLAHARFGHAIAIGFSSAGSLSFGPYDSGEPMIGIGAPRELADSRALYFIQERQLRWDSPWTRRFDRSDFGFGDPQAGDQLGWSLEHADDPDHQPDEYDGYSWGPMHAWAFGAPGWKVDGVAGAGAVIVTNDFLDVGERRLEDAAQLLTDPKGRMNGALGTSLASGDFDGDKHVDLAAGGLFDGGGSGQVLLWHRMPDGPDQTVIYQDPKRIRSFDMGGKAEKGDKFGTVLASGDLDGDGFDDLAIGTPGEDRDNSDRIDGGEITLMYGSRDGLGAWNITFGPSRATEPEDGDRFGSCIIAADDKLFVGMPGREWSSGLVVGVSDL